MILKSNRRISPRITIWRLLLTLMVTSVVGQKMSRTIEKEICYHQQELDKLTNAQRQDCFHHPAAFKYSLIGLRRAEEECKRLLIKNTWNCTGLIEQAQKTLKNHDWTSIMSKSYPETAFANAMIAAGITYEITKACIKGQINVVHGCQRKTSKNYYKDFYIHEDTVASTNCIDKCVEYAKQRAEAFQIRTDSSLDYTLARKNQKVGERLVFRSRRESCRCMGPSGSCTWKYCVKSIEDFSKIASNLYSKYKEKPSLQKITVNMNGPQPDIKSIPDRILVYMLPLDICSANGGASSVSLLNQNRGRLCKLPRDKKKTSKRTTIEKSSKKKSRHKKGRYRRNQRKKNLGKCTAICCNNNFKEVQIVEKFKHNMKFSWNKDEPISWDVRKRNVTYGVCT
ncbi:Oidioi.mRNA.OKI2018_I69.PAR.g13007.t1.cds [Oikopleura dioica]|uniref:Protein Wnt n=1 Tax=Oikopleura dioica TaxID=34765 RepID=A0ABN7S787_OIKDI|nr:Oidioi.mRNA.OKI2018_I69.PAR.g13007.t1.cds [Oikopleura dioica]